MYFYSISVVLNEKIYNIKFGSDKPTFDKKQTNNKKQHLKGSKILDFSHLHLLFKLKSIKQSHTSPEPFAPFCIPLCVWTRAGPGHPCQHS